MFYARHDREKGFKQGLREHLQAVAETMENSVSPSVRFRNLTNRDVAEMARWIGFLHDFGKYTPFFQEYLLHGKESRLKNHAHISACFLYALLLEMFEGRIAKLEKYAWAFLGYLVVRQHHGSLTLKRLFSAEDMWEVLQQQADSLIKQREDILREMALGERLDSAKFHDCLRIERLKNDRGFFYYMPQYLANRLKDDQWYFALIYLFSLLIDADKLDSAGVKKEAVKSTPPDRVEHYLSVKHEGRKTDSFDTRREKARKTILSVIDDLTDEEIRQQRFFTLTAPTGIGKTLSALQCALRLQERIRKTEGYTPRVITAIPFINIIEQTKKDYEGVFGAERVLAHHRLSDYAAEERETKEEVPLDQRMLEVESWEADAILTTFVQFFHSIVTGENRPLKKVNKLAGSIVILDEIQSIPDVYMPLVGALLRKLADYYGTRFILMTATQPKLLELGDRLLGSESQQPVELLPEHERYFRELKRTRFVPLLTEKQTSETLVDLILKKYQPQRSVLVVVNTIRRSIELFNLLRERQQAGEIGQATEIYYLSTNIIPKRRMEVVRTVKEKLKNGHPVILISTQTIEAGVDLDFDMGFRDLAPMESLIQTAGRINREGRKEDFAPLFIVRLEKDHQYVYAKHHLDRTEKLLQNREEILEPEYRELVEAYYQELLAAGVSDESRQLWEQGIVGLDFAKLKEFQLLERMGEVVDVFVELDSTASLLADAYEELIREPWEPKALCNVFPSLKKDEPPTVYGRRNLLRLLSAKMSEYMVQIRAKRAVANRPLEFSSRNGVKASFLWIPPEEAERYYDPVTGFRDETGEAFIW
ncbi:CRISPR-associated helicase/endonuclease Cas3 [Bacillaceae bacterium]